MIRVRLKVLLAVSLGIVLLALMVFWWGVQSMHQMGEQNEFFEHLYSDVANFNVTTLELLHEDRVLSRFSQWQVLNNEIGEYLDDSHVRDESAQNTLLIVHKNISFSLQRFTNALKSCSEDQLMQAKDYCTVYLNRLRTQAKLSLQDLQVEVRKMKTRSDQKIEADAFTLGLIILSLPILMSIFIVIAVLPIMQTLGTGLQSLLDACERFKLGDYGFHVDTSAKNEIGILAAALNNMAEHLNLYQQQAPLASIEWNTDFEVINWNKAAEEMFGYSLEEVKDKAFVDIMLPAHAEEKARQIWVDLIAKTGETKVTIENLTKDGKVIVCEWHNSPIKDNEGNLIGAASLVLDITDRQLALEALQNKEKEQREILNSMVDAVISIGERGMILSFNQSAEKLFGYASEEIIGQNVSRLMFESYAGELDDYKYDYATIEDTYLGGVGREIKGHRKNQQVFPMRLSVAEVTRDKASGRRRFIGTFQDLTLIKQQEEQLRRSQKMDALGKLTGGLAHDYNNILGVILGYSELLQEKLASQPKLANYVKQITKASKRGAKLTRKLLAFSRHGVSEASIMDINSFLLDEQDMLQKTLTVRINLVFDLTDDVWPVLLDSSDLEGAVLNMSINAMHAMSDMDTGAQLTIQTRNQSLGNLDSQLLGIDTGDYVLLSLTDTGVGMDELIREQIFDPFFSTKDDKGTGLGLSQVFGFINRSDSAIKVYSELGKGSQFVLYFPRYHEKELGKVVSVSDSPANLRGNEGILVVDDEISLLNICMEMLSNQGYKVFCAEGGKQALQILELESIDLLLSDVIMPEMDGYKLARIVQEKYPAIKIQLASGFSDDRHGNEMDEILHLNLLHKPYNSIELFKSVRALLDA